MIDTGATASRVFSDIYIRENDRIKKKGCIVRTVNTAVSMLFGKKRSKLLRPYVIKKIIRIQPKKKQSERVRIIPRLASYYHKFVRTSAEKYIQH